MIAYTIKPPYPWQKLEDAYQLDILSDELEYSELEQGIHHIQVKNLENKDLILEKCQQITNLIREINALNQP